MFIEYYAGSTPTLTYYGKNANLGYDAGLDNFLIKTMTINPISTYDDGNSPFLIFGGELKNKSYMNALLFVK